MGIQLGSAYGKVVIDASGARKGIDEAKGSVTSLSKTFGTLSKGLATGAAVIVGVGATLKKAFDMAEEGASVVQTTESFKSLLGEIGAAPDLLSQLQRASRGTISDLDLMSSTTTLLMGAQGELATSLANATPQLMEMARAASKLNPSLGDTTFMYESLAKGIKRGSPMILDNLGIIVKVEEANRAYAESIGKTTDQLTAEEQKIALLNAVLAQGETLMAQAGGSTESAADSYQALAAATENTKNKFLAMMHEGLEPAAEAAAILLSWNDKVNAMLVEQNAALLQNTSSYKDYLTQRTEALVIARDLSAADAQQILTLQNNQAVVDSYTQKYGGLNRQKLEGLLVTGQLSMSQDAETIAVLRAAVALQELSDENKLLTEFEYNRLQSLAEVTEQEEELGRHSEYLQRQLRGETEAMEEQSAATEDLSAAMNDLQTIVSGRLGKATEDYAESQGKLADKMADVEQKIQDLSGQDWLSEEQQSELDGLQEEYAELGEQYTKNAEEHQQATKQILFDLLSQRAALDGLSGEEMGVLTTIAQKWGLIDEQTAAAMNGFDEALSILASGGSVEDATNAILGIGEAAGVAADGVETELNGIDLTPTIERVAALLGQVFSIAGTHPLIFDVSVTGDSIPDGNWVNPRVRPVNELAAHGLDMVVPAGFSEPNNPFLVGTSSGEHVKVTPEGESGGTPVVVQNMNFYGPTEPPAVQRAANDGVLAAARRRGAR